LVSGLNRGSQGNTLLAPVPATSGQQVCLTNPGSVDSATWQVFNLMGERIADISFGGEGAECWNTTGTAPGLYLVEIDVVYGDGTKATIRQKVVITK
jgi:hypothetical protein